MEGGTWGLVIILAAFMIQVLAFGATAAIGVYNIELLDYFPGATVEVSLIGSLNFGIFLGSGPIVSFLLTKFSYRKIALFGSCLVVIGILGMPLLPYIPAMCICFGVLAGFGSCCAYIPSHVLSGVYYDKYRSLATGVATSGSGLGGAIMPVLAGALIDVYSWKGSLIIIAGLCLHLIVFSALLRSPPVYTSDTVVGPSKQATNKCLSQETQDETKALVTEGSERKHEEMIQEDEVHDFNGVDMNRLDFIDTASLKADHPSQENMMKKLNGESFPNPSVNGETILQTKVDKDVSANESENVQLIHSAGNDLAKHPKHHSVSHSSLSSIGATRGSGYIVIDRDKNVHLSSVPEEKKDDTEAQNKMPSSSRHIFIFTNYGFDVYFLSNIMWNAGCSIITAFAPEFLREKGLTPMEAAWLSGAFGFGCFAGGILGGLFGNFKWVNRQVLYTGANLCMGVILIMFPTFNHIGLYLACLIVSGIAFGIILGLLIVVLTDIIGIDSLGNGLGYLMLANGLGTFMGPPMAGLLKDKYGDFGAGIILSGILCLIGGFIMMLMPLKRFYRKGDKSVQSVNEKL